MKYLLIALIFLAGCNPHHHTTEKGVDCVEVNIGYSVAISCNFEAWNAQTNYGMHPIAIEKQTDLEVD